MPEGDTIRAAARRIRPVLLGRAPEIRTPHPRFARDRWPERLHGRAVTSVDTHGKHLFLHFEGDLLLHSHLRMTGLWGVYPPERRWGRSPRRAWLVLGCQSTEVVQFDGPILELLTNGRRRFDHRLAALGPDILADEFNEAKFLARVHADDATRTLGDALLDQRLIAGIGNVWKSEGCWQAGIDPWRRLADVSDAELVAIVAETRPRMFVAADTGRQRERHIYNRTGHRCPRCGGRIQGRGQGDDNRTTFWCPSCQR